MAGKVSWRGMYSGKEAIKHKLSASQNTGQNNTQKERERESVRERQTQTANLLRVFAGQVKQNELRIMKQYTKPSLSLSFFINVFPLSLPL